MSYNSFRSQFIQARARESPSHVESILTQWIWTEFVLSCPESLPFSWLPNASVKQAFQSLSLTEKNSLSPIFRAILEEKVTLSKEEETNVLRSRLGVVWVCLQWKQIHLSFDVMTQLLHHWVLHPQLIPFSKLRTLISVYIHASIVETCINLQSGLVFRLNPRWSAFRKTLENKQGDGFDGKKIKQAFLEGPLLEEDQDPEFKHYFHLSQKSQKNRSIEQFMTWVSKTIEFYKLQGIQQDKWTRFHPDFLYYALFQEPKNTVLSHAEKVRWIETSILSRFPSHDLSLVFVSDYYSNHLQHHTNAVELLDLNMRSLSARTQQDTLFGLACAFYKQMKLEESRKMYQLLLAKNRWFSHAWNNLGIVFRDTGEMGKAIECFERSCEMFVARLDNSLAIENFFVSCHNLFLCSNNVCVYRPQDVDFKTFANQVSLLHLTWNNLVQHSCALSQFQYQPFSGSGQPKKHKNKTRLTLGLLSGDFFYHSVAFFLESFLSHYNPSLLRVVCFSNVPVHQRDKKTEDLKKCVGGEANWKDVCALTYQELYNLVRLEEVDVLVDLSGHTSSTRLLLFNARAAPIQVSWIGYPNTTGVRQMDYRICDPLTDTLQPKDQIQTFSEQLVYRPDRKCFLCYRLQEWHPTLCKETLHAFQRNGFITFGSFNHISKITDSVLFYWCAILKQVPLSRFLLKSKFFSTDKGKETWLQKFQTHGIDPARVQLVPFSLTGVDHIQQYQDMDISLDTFPYSGTTTTCESMVMGTPVITFYQPRHTIHSQNVSASLISAVDGQQWENKSLFEYCAATSVEEYVSKAVWLAHQPRLLAQIKTDLRQVMQKSSLCNQKEYADQITQLFLSLTPRSV